MALRAGEQVSVVAGRESRLTQQVARDDDDDRASGVPQPWGNGLDDLLRGRGGPWRERDGHADTLAQDRVGDGDGRRFGDSAVEVQGVLDLGRGDVLAPADDDVLGWRVSIAYRVWEPTSVADEQETLVIDVANVSGVKPPLGVDRLPGRLWMSASPSAIPPTWVVEVRLHDVRAAHEDEARLADTQLLARVLVDNLEAADGDGRADTARLVMSGADCRMRPLATTHVFQVVSERVGRVHGARLGHAVALEAGQVSFTTGPTPTWQQWAIACGHHQACARVEVHHRSLHPRRRGPWAAMATG